MLHSHLHLHIGKREEQQDCAVCFTKGNAMLAVVADGVGGTFGGARASQAIVDVATRLWNAWQVDASKIESFLKTLVAESHTAILESGKEVHATPHSTIVALLIVDDVGYRVHVGDSRLYHIRKGAVLERTLDHSIVQLLVSNGKLAPEKAKGHKDSSKLYQSLGSSSEAEADVAPLELEHRDSFILCSDGLWQSMEDAEIASIAVSPKTLSGKLKEAVHTAFERGGEECDNISAVGVIYEQSFAKRHIPAFLRNPLNVFLIIALIGIGIYLVHFFNADIWREIEKLFSAPKEENVIKKTESPLTKPLQQSKPSQQTNPPPPQVPVENESPTKKIIQPPATLENKGGTERK